MQILWIAVLLLLPGQLVPPERLIDDWKALCKAENGSVSIAIGNIAVGTETVGAAYVRCLRPAESHE